MRARSNLGARHVFLFISCARSSAASLPTPRCCLFLGESRLNASVHETAANSPAQTLYAFVVCHSAGSCRAMPCPARSHRYNLADDAVHHPAIRPSPDTPMPCLPTASAPLNIIRPCCMHISLVRLGGRETPAPAVIPPDSLPRVQAINTV